MFLRKAAIRSVPRYAVVDEEAIARLEETLEDEESLQESLDQGYRDLDAQQPVLSEWLADRVAEREDEFSQSLGYFLAIGVYLAFREAFGIRLLEVDETNLSVAIETFTLDEELRRDDPSEVLGSDEVIALGQPTLIEFIQHHMREAFAQAGDTVDPEGLEGVYRAVLVEIIALSQAVAPPAGEQAALD